MALQNLGEGGGGGFDWNQFQQEGQQPDMANGGYMGTGSGGMLTPAVQPERAFGQPMGGQQPGAPAQAGTANIEQIKALVGSDYSPAHLQQILPQLKALGVEVQNQARGDLRPRFLLPGGEQWDFGPGGWINSGHGIQAGFGDASQAPGGGTLGQIGQAGGGDSRMDELRNTPGYQFSFDEGMRGVQNSAFAKGTGLTGGTLKRIAQYAGGLASQRYDTQNQQYLDWSKLGQNAALGASS